MFASLLQNLFASEWQVWTAPMLGLVSTGLTVSLTCFLMGRRNGAATLGEMPIGLGQLDPFVHGSAPEQRSSPRRKGNPVPVRIADSLVRSIRDEGWVHDRSTGGLGLVVGKPIEPGTVLTVRPMNAPVGMPWVEMRVRSCTPQDGNFKLGCEFLFTPTWNIMLMFG